MNTADLDIVYFVKDGFFKNEELRYSLRSVAKNMPHRKVWIFGGAPVNILPDVRIKTKQEGRTKWDKVRAMFLLACNSKDLTDDFILFNDDFFIMKPTDKIEPVYRCPLDKHIEILEKFRPTEYSRLLRDCLNTLKGKGVKQPLSYELHTPFIFNKEKLKKILDEFPDQHCTRTIYGNIYGIGGERMNDIKMFTDKPEFDYKKSQFLSTDDSMVNINNDAWRYIRDSFKNKSEFEIY